MLTGCSTPCQLGRKSQASRPSGLISWAAFHFRSAAGSASRRSFLFLQQVKLIPMCSPVVRRPIITQVLHEGAVITEQSLCTLVGKGASFTAESEEVALLCLSTFGNRTK